MEPQSPGEAAEELPGASALISNLKTAISSIHQNHCRYVPNPPSCKKRASVALVVRIRPTFPQMSHYDSNNCGLPVGSFQKRLDNFFAQNWVQQGEPEVLFIKRAARKGDRWTSHIAFPGGKRELDDLNDRSTSLRETREEVGLDLDVDHFLMVGNLAERVVATSWGKVPLMVLCPFVYLAMRYDLPPLTLQPSEVASAYWVPVRALLSPALRTFERCDVADRMTRPGHQVLRITFRIMLGKMLFRAVELIPSESVYSSPFLDALSEDRTSGAITTNIYSKIESWSFRDNPRTNVLRRPLLLWGLTLGITADFLGSISLEGASCLWAWPTLSSWDIRIVIWIMTHSFRTRNLRESSDSFIQPQSSDTDTQEADVGELDSGTFTKSVRRSPNGLRLVAGEVSLNGYFNLVRRAIIITISARVCFGSLLIALLLRRYQRC